MISIKSLSARISDLEHALQEQGTGFDNTVSNFQEVLKEQEIKHEDKLKELRTHIQDVEKELQELEKEVAGLDKEIKEEMNNTKQELQEQGAKFTKQIKNIILAVNTLFGEEMLKLEDLQI